MKSISPATLRFLRNAIVDGSQLWPAACPALSSHASRRALQLKSSTSASLSPTITPQRFFTTSPRVQQDEDDSLLTLHTILKKAPETHYDFFPTSIPSGPPPSGPFTLDIPSVRREFIQLQALAHPDRHPPERRAAAQGLSARINDAYKTLTSPLRRAEYLLELRGARGYADDEHVLGQAEGDEEILMEVMEAREEAEEAEGEEEIRRLREENQKRIDGVVGRLEEAFKRDDLLAAKREAVRLSYWVGVEDRLRTGSDMH